MEIIKFIFNPKEALEKDKNISTTIFRYLLLICISFILSFVAIFLTQLLMNLELIPKLTREIPKSSVRHNLLYAGFLFPLIEELGFRLYLRRSKLNIFISSAIMTYMIISVFIFDTSSFSLEKKGVLRILISILVAAIALIIYNKKIVKLKFNHLYYLSALVFGLIHLSNSYTSFNINIIVFGFIICLPQIVGGLLFGYARIKYGVIGAIILHGLINTILYILPIFIN